VGCTIPAFGPGARALREGRAPRRLTTRTTAMLDLASPSRPPIVLVANDQEWSARSFESLLGPAGFAVLRAYTGRQTIELARRARPEAVLVDWRLSDMDGLEIVRLLRADAQLGGVLPVMMTASAPASRAQIVAAHEAGAWDFLNDPIDGELLLLRLRNYVTARQAVDLIEAESLVDQLTGLYNYRGLVRRAHELTAEAARGGGALSCVAFAPNVRLDDLDEALAARAFAKVIEHVGAVCRRHGRASDVFGRFGQTEFAMLAPATEREGIVHLVERLRRSVEQEPVHVGSDVRRLTLTVGYTSASIPADAREDPSGLLARAAAALRYGRVARAPNAVVAFEEIPSAERPAAPLLQ
jgi:diguanylate cyclase (GGDEF)-like protein